MSGDFTFLKGNIETIILCSLYNEDKYGYEIAKEIRDRTDNKYEIKQPTLYSYLKRLEEDELIVSYWGESSNGGRRRYYKLTKVGKQNCEKFVAEWKYHRNVLEGLVDGTDVDAEATQGDVTPLFGRRSPKQRNKKNTTKAAIDQQEEIARRLRELTGGNSDDVQDVQQDEPQPVVASTEPIEPVIEPIPQTQVVAPVEPIAQPSQEDVRSRFDINQDDADDFLQGFNILAEQATTSNEPIEGENYQHVLMGVLGDQLDGAQNVDDYSQPPVASTTYAGANNAAALEDVADTLAKEGIRIRIYNHAAAAYKSKMLIPQAKVLCQTAWLTYAVAFVFFGILALVSISSNNWQAFVITAAVVMLAPIAFSIYAIADPTRKEKRPFNFKLFMIVSSIACGIIVVASVAFSAFSKTEFGDFVAVSKQILIPLGIAILLPTSVFVYNLLYKQY